MSLRASSASYIGGLTIDELMLKLKTEAMHTDDFMEIVWDYDTDEQQGSMFELNKLLIDDLEFKQEKEKLDMDIHNAMKDVMKKHSEKIEYIDTSEVDMMTAEEIMEKIKCQCKEFKNKYAKKAELLKSEQVSNKPNWPIEVNMGPAFISDSSSLSRGTFGIRKSDLPLIGAGCKEFLHVKDYAVSFIDQLLQEAEEKVNMEPHGLSLDTVLYGEDGEPISLELESTKSKSKSSSELLSWITYLLIEDFTPKAGKQLILEIIENTWNIRKHWTYCINLMVENSDTCADFYVYEVKWSVPTMSYPIPQVTASAYFTIEVSRVKPSDCPVTVTYTFETERYKFTPEDDIQQDVFLNNIMKCKLDFFRNCRV